MTYRRGCASNHSATSSLVWCEAPSIHSRICPRGCSVRISSSHWMVASESCQSIQKVLVSTPVQRCSARFPHQRGECAQPLDSSNLASLTSGHGSVAVPATSSADLYIADMLLRNLLHPARFDSIITVSLPPSLYIYRRSTSWCGFHIVVDTPNEKGQPSGCP